MEVKPSSAPQQIKVVNQNNHQVVILPHFKFTSQIQQLLKHLKTKELLNQFQKSNKIIEIQVQRQIFGRTNQLDQQQESTINLNKNLSIIFSHYNFNNLQNLYLGESYLTNCQFLMFMDLPKLMKLFINGNYIHNFQPFNRSNLPCLQHFDINTNISSQLRIQRFRFYNNPLFLNIEVFSDQKTQHQDLSFIAKFQSRKQLKMMIHQNRVQQNYKRKVLCQKVSEISSLF